MLCECQSELAAEWARLDWLQAQEVKRGLEITEGRDDPLPFLVLGEDGTTHWGKTYRAAIDAAMKEGVAPAAPKSDQNAPKLNQTGANRPASPRPS